MFQSVAMNEIKIHLQYFHLHYDWKNGSCAREETMFKFEKRIVLLLHHSEIIKMYSTRHSKKDLVKSFIVTNSNSQPENDFD